MLPVLMYHDLVRTPHRHHTTAQAFSAHVDALARAGYHFWRSNTFAAKLRGLAPTQRGVMITFDDGYASLLRDALPVLQRHSATACVFVITSKMGDGPPRTGAALRDCEDAAYLRWSELELLLTSGCVEVHSHTHEHRPWRRIANLQERLDTLHNDLCRSRHLLNSRLGLTSDHLAWPWGDFDTHYLDTGRDAGFRWFYAAHRRANRVGDSGLEIGRVNGEGRSAAGLMRTLRLAHWGTDDLLSTARAARALWRTLST